MELIISKNQLINHLIRHPMKFSYVFWTFFNYRPLLFNSNTEFTHTMIKIVKPMIVFVYLNIYICNLQLANFQVPWDLPGTLLSPYKPSFYWPQRIKCLPTVKVEKKLKLMKMLNRFFSKVSLQNIGLHGAIKTNIERKISLYQFSSSSRNSR